MHKWWEVYYIIYAAKIALGGRGHQKLFPEYTPAHAGITLGVRELDLAACSITMSMIVNHFWLVWFVMLYSFQGEYCESQKTVNLTIVLYIQLEEYC